MTSLYDATGNRITLDKKLAEGGEGAVFDVIGHPDLVAKLYTKQPERTRIEKLLVMSQLANTDLLQVAAWPVSILRRQPRSEPLGFLMPRIGGREAHVLYGPKQRQAEFPSADWKFLLAAARNIAAAVATVHAAGHIIGDINQKGFLIERNATVRLIDCDSFQISARGRLYPCVVGVPEFTAPELQGQRFDTLARTIHHDGFGLAVLIFQILFMGRHPFAGRFVGRGEMPPERAIREFRFAYSQTAATKEMLPPPHALNLGAVSYDVASLFERAFSSQGARVGRPFATEWIASLEQLSKELKACDVDRTHKFHLRVPACPWCAIEKAGGPSFFLSAGAAIDFGSGFDVSALINELSTLNLSGIRPDAPPIGTSAAVTPRPLPEDLVTRRRLSILLFVMSGLVLLGATLSGIPGFVIFGVALGVIGAILRSSPALQKERADRKAALDDASRALHHLRAAWRTETKAMLDGQLRILDVAVKLANEYKNLPNKLQAEQTALHQKREALQRKEFLERHLVYDAALEGIGPGLKQILLSHGIETAADITPALQVSGFGPARRATLLSWRLSVESRFRFDPRKGVSPADVAAVKHRYALQKKELERHLMQRRLEMHDLLKRAKSLLEIATSRFEAAANQHSQARADHLVLARFVGT